MEDRKYRCFSDISPITLRRQRALKILMIRYVGRYKWGLPFKLIISYNSQQIIIKNEEETHLFDGIRWTSRDGTIRSEGTK